jgi:hypothetical protein
MPNNRLMQPPAAVYPGRLVADGRWLYELEGWYNDPAVWPAKRDLQLFKK